MAKMFGKSNESAQFMIWLAGVLFVLLQFFLQLSSGIIIGAIMSDLRLSALMAGILGSSIYFVYTTFQIPVGILFDRQNTRTLLYLSAFICSIGCLVFASSYTMTGLIIGRLLIGAGSAFAFVGYSHILRQYFDIRRFAFMMGLSETLAFIATVIGMISMGELIAVYGWRQFIYGTGVFGLIVTFLCWQFIPNSKSPTKDRPHYGLQLIHIIKNRQVWINGIMVGLSFTVVTVFGALWSIPFIQVKFGCTLALASILGAMFFLGAGVSCPLFGLLANYISRKFLILSSCLSTGCLLLVVIYAPISSQIITGLLMFAIGCCCGAYMLAFSISNELAPRNSLSTCTGFTNTLAMLTAPVFQTLIGYLLDISSKDHSYTVAGYQFALIPIPAAMFLAGVLVIFIKERKKPAV
jgi:MFS family permease